jgi:glycosyltransferase involved in cell wall biosynthesis
MTARAQIALVANGLTIGGTEKGLVTYALELDRGRFDIRVVGAHELGPRQAALDKAGIPVSCAEGEGKRLRELLSGSDLVHVWRAGAGEALAPAAATDCGASALVETNVFGLVDRSRHARNFDCHLFLSASCAVRYRRRLGMRMPEFHRGHRVLPLPLDPRFLEAAPPREEAKRRLGLDPSRPVVGRIGRADDLKWRNLLVDMVPTLLRLVPEAQLLLVGATRAKRRRLERRGVIESCVLHAPVAAQEELATLYAACDVFVSAAELGESQGLALAEAMAFGLPVVTCSTPWVDNAQLEYVRHGRTGYVANHPRPFAQAVAALLADSGLREELGRAGRAHVTRRLEPGPLTRRLESLYESLLAGVGLPERWEPGASELEAFETGQRRREQAEFKPLTLVERTQARAVREAERLRRLRGLLRPSRLPLAAAFARERLAAAPLRRGGERARP